MSPEASIIYTGEFGSPSNYSSFNNITCSELAIESSLSSCDITITDCLPLCPNGNVGIRCFGESIIEIVSPTPLIAH